MAKRNRFPPEPETQPDLTRKAGVRTSGAAPKSKRARAEEPTLPPPKSKRTQPAMPRPSGVKQRKPHASESPAATVDEVTADLSKDPRRERE
jgi:hypothetical protein